MGRSQDDPDRVVLSVLTATPMRERGTDEQGRRYWRIRHRQTRQTLRTGWWTRAEVEVVIAEVLRNPTPSRPSAPAAGLTVGELLDRWAKVQAERHAGGEIAERTLVNYRQAARHWKSSVADVLASRLSRELAEDTLRGWRAAGVSARSAKLAADVLSAATRWGAPRGLCPSLDLKWLSPAQVDPEERVNCEYTPTRAEADAVLALVQPGRDRITVELLGLTGARVGEVAALRVGSWDRDRGELSISGRDRTRGRRGKVRTRRWPVLGRLVELLGELTAGRPPEAPLVEGLPGGVSDMVQRVLAHACEAAGVERYTAHGLRRLVAVELLDIADPKTVSELTGHSVGVLLRDYVRPRPERLRDVVARSVRRQAPALQLVEAGSSPRAQGPGTADDDDGEGA